MENDNKKQKDQPLKKDKKRVLPEEDTYGPKPDDTSMSSGNLTNNPIGRTRTRDLHTKISITGSDDDGQAD
ncbi:MAG TPA: hypothetical protein VGI82_08455 [Chitinophagaceae bacterium]|jgi:hypothetical protein